MKNLAFLFGFFLVLSSSALAQAANTTNSTNTTNITNIYNYLPCGIKGCTILYGFIADFQPTGGVRLLNLNGVIIRVEPYSANTLNESGFDVRYRLPYTYSNNDSFIALPINIAQGLDQTRFNSLVAENGQLKGDLFLWQIIAILAIIYTVGSYTYNYWLEHQNES